MNGVSGNESQEGTTSMSTGIQATRTEEEPPLFPYDRYEANMDEISVEYAANSPVPHMFFPNFLDEGVAQQMAAEFPDHDDETWIQYKHVNENKAGLHVREALPDLIGRVIDELNSPACVSIISKITGIEGLIADPTIEGGGMHQAARGGYLNVHTDFTMHRQIPRWRRRVNLILYLNENWDTSWGGSIDFWSSGMKERLGSYPPILNGALLFSTPGALHGFPDPLTCPENRARKSVQLYYYTLDDDSKSSPHSTEYFARPEDSPLRRFLIRLDNKMLEVYAWMKRRLGISDETVSRVLRLLGRKKH